MIAMPEVAITLVSDGISNWSVVSTDTPGSQLAGFYAPLASPAPRLSRP